MKFKNTTGIDVRVRFKAQDNAFGWKTIKAGETIELEESYGYRLGFEPVKEKKIEKTQKEVKKESKGVKNTPIPMKKSSKKRKKNKKV